MTQHALYFEDGKLVIYQRGRFYYSRIYTGNSKYIWRSLRTTSSKEAKIIGYKTYFDLLNKKDRGLPVTSVRFTEAIDEYVACREQQTIHGKTKLGMLRQVKRIAKFWREYAGFKLIEEVNNKILSEYEDWRRNYYTERYIKRGKPLPRNAKLHPTDKTIQFDVMVGKAVLKWAQEQGLRGNQPLPTYNYTPKHKRVRPAFELTDYRTLCRTLWNRVRAAKNKRERESRQLLRDYVLILANSGLRVGELNNLKLRDVQRITDPQGRPNFELKVSGKTGQRVAIPRASSAKFFLRVIRRRENAKPTDFLFVMPDGSKITTLIDQFNAALREAGLTHASHGEKYTLYSLRHFYAVMALRRGTEVFQLATNMGTSVEIIQKYYGKHAKSPMFATALGN